MSLRTDLLKQVLAWVETVLGITGDGATPQVILAQRGEKSPRLPLPYLTLTFTTFDQPKGTVEHAFSDETKHFLAARTAMLEIRGFGPESDEWLQELGLRVGDFAGDGTIVDLAGSAMLDLSGLVSTDFEEQYLKEFVFEYAITDDTPHPTADQTTLTVADVDDTFEFSTVFSWE